MCGREYVLSKRDFYFWLMEIVLPSMDPANVQRRIHHATAVVLAEHEHGSLYTLSAASLFQHSSLQQK
jgi:hypothetical protein